MAGKTSNRFLLEIEEAIIKANRQAVKERLGPLDRARFLELTKEIAKIRADYLHAALHTPWSTEAEPSDDLRVKRNRYEEAVAAYDALERAVERGYIDFKD